MAFIITFKRQLMYPAIQICTEKEMLYKET